jgi:hypothetical protein
MNEKASYMSGTQLKNFRKGWAVHIGTWGKGHYWTRIDFEAADSACGLIAPTRYLYAVGSWPYCKTCLRIKQGKKAA